MSYDIFIDNLMISKDLNRDLYLMRNLTQTPRTTSDFYGDLWFWLSLENNPPAYYFFGGNDYFSPGNSMDIRSSLIFSTEAAKVGSQGYLIHATESDLRIIINLGYQYNPITSKGRFGCWFKLQTAIYTTPAYLIRFIYPGHDDQYSLLYDINSGTMKLKVEVATFDTGWSPVVGTWYFIEWVYDFPNGTTSLVVDNTQVYTTTFTPVSPFHNQIIFGNSMGMYPTIYLDNLMMSYKTDRNLYELRDLEICPKIT